MPVYFAAAGEFVKIGWSRDPVARLDDLQTGCPFPIRLAAMVPGGRRLEREYHLRFICLAVELRWGISGPGGLPFPVNEWFHLTGELREYVEQLAAGGAPLWTCRRPDEEWYPSTAFRSPEEKAETLRREMEAVPPHDRWWLIEPEDGDADEDCEPIPF